MDYAAVGTKADTLLRRVGLRVKITRAGVSVGSGFGVFDETEKKDETASTSSRLVQSQATTRTLYLSGSVKSVQVGDVISADKDSWTVTIAEPLRPADITVLYKLEVI